MKIKNQRCARFCDTSDDTGGYLGASIILAAVTVALTLYLPILIGQAVDRIVGKGAVDFAGIFVILRKMAVIIGLTAVAQW